VVLVLAAFTPVPSAIRLYIPNTAVISKKYKLIATDIDGVWTDGSMYFSPEGDVMKVFYTYDGMTVQILRDL
jgi:hypothetical protein